ncbi:PhnD/SsuA/transferrin family substrate-binding protein [Chloroflexi bacterium TSY]|nr:PhnD/SsuA/transferrin family substrate-binding protein [Chloroflexi bacterium TSY]
MVQSLKVISIQSESADATCHQITHYLGEQLGIAAEFVNDISWQERERLLDTQQVHLGWICGLPYVDKVDRHRLPLELVAAPVMERPRYQQQPIYYSDVIVHRESHYNHFADLRGVSWAYNEPKSQSGYNATRYYLAQLSETKRYFGRVVEVGSHLHAIDLVLERRIEASAIDSTVLEMEFQLRPDLKRDLRVIEVFGPSPIPPWVMTTTVPTELRQPIREVFWQMHETPEGKAILEAGQIQRLVEVGDRDYDPIREMARAAAQVIW